jgi:PEGA domain-containing protein
MPKKSIFLMFVMSALSLAVAAQSPAPQHPSAAAAPATSELVDVVLADGTPIKLGLADAALSNARVGENLDLEVAEDVRVSGVVVISKGSVATGEVTGLRAGLGGNHIGRVDISLRSVTLADGQIVPIRSTKEAPSRSDQAMVISNSGQDASIAPGTTVTAYINGKQPLDMSRLRAAGGPAVDLKVNSTPVNAEVSIDGRLNASTPYVFHVRAGDHTVVVRMAGFQAWQNTVHVGADAVQVEVKLAKQDGSEAMPATKAAEHSLGDLARAARSRKPQSATPATDQKDSSAPRDPMQPVTLEQ